jgi:hypothetical protein
LSAPGGTRCKVAGNSYFISDGSPIGHASTSNCYLSILLFNVQTLHRTNPMNPNCNPKNPKFTRLTRALPQIDSFEFLRPLCESRLRKFPYLQLPYWIFLPIAHVMESLYRTADILGVRFEPFLTKAELFKVCKNNHAKFESRLKPPA